MKRFLAYLSIISSIVLYSLLVIISLFMLINFSYNLTHLNDRDKIKREVILEYNYLKSLLDAPDKKAKTKTNGWTDFASSEWPIQTLSLFCYGTRNLVMANPHLKEEAVEYMRKAIERVRNPEYYHFTVAHFGNPFTSDTIRDNAFYLGHFTNMLALYREVSQDSRYDELFHKFARAFYENYKQSPTVCLDSYRGMAWTSEQAPPFRALYIHDQVFGTNYKEVIHQWEAMMKERFIDYESKLLVTGLNKSTGKIWQGPRAIPNTWTILFLHEVLPEFCKKLYTHVKKQFLVQRLKFPAFKEYLGDRQYSDGDTGPIIADVSAVSTCFGMGCAGIYGDSDIFSDSNVAADGIGLAFTWRGRRRYLLGGQVGTAAVFWCRTMALLSDTPFKPSKGVKTICVLLLVALLLFGLRLWRLIVQLRKLNRSSSL